MALAPGVPGCPADRERVRLHEVPAETLEIDTFDAQHVRVRSTRVLSPSVTLENELVLERQSVAVVIAALGRLLSSPGHPEVTRRVGGDSLRVYESGDEPRLWFNVHNRRPEGRPSPGLSTITLTTAGARKLIELLGSVSCPRASTPPPSGMRVVYVDRAMRFSLEVDEECGRTFVGIEVRNAMVEYTEWYAVEAAAFERYRADPSLAHDFVARAKRRELDHLLLLPPGADRGVAD